MRGSSPRIAIDVARSPRLVLACLTAWCVGSIACLTLALTGAPVRALVVAATLALSIKPALLLLGLSPDSVCRFAWTRRSSWYLRTAEGRWMKVSLQPETTLIGPLILLVWRDPGRCRRYALVDAGATEARAFRRLSGRLRLEACWALRSAVDNYC